MLSLIDRTVLIDKTFNSTRGNPLFLHICKISTVMIYITEVIYNLFLALYAITFYNYCVTMLQVVVNDLKNKRITKIFAKKSNIEVLSNIIVLIVANLMIFQVGNVTFENFLTNLGFIFLFYINLICFFKMFLPSAEWRPKFTCCGKYMPLVGAVVCLFLQMVTVAEDTWLLIGLILPLLIAYALRRLSYL